MAIIRIICHFRRYQQGIQMHHFAKSLIIWILLCLCLLINHQAHADQYQQIKRFTVDDGLPSATVYSIIEQNTGHLLLGTDKGITRYDGYSFETFSKNNGNFVFNNASNLFIDSKENIWIGSWGEGLAIYDQHLNLLHHHKVENGFPAKIRAFLEDNQGNIWVASGDGGLLLFKQSITTYNQYRHLPNIKNSLSHNQIWQITQTHPGYLWLATSNGLNRFDINNQQFEHFIPNFNTPQGILDNTIRSIITSPDNKQLLIGTNDNLAIFNIEKQTFEQHKITNKLLTLGANQFKYGQNGDLLIATIVGLFSVEIDEIFCCTNQQISLQAIIEDVDIRYIAQMNNDVIWIGTRHAGLIKLNQIHNAVVYIDQFINQQNNKNLLGHVYTFFKDHDNTIWIGTRNNLVYLKPGSNLPQQIPLKHNFNRINTIARTATGQLIVRDNHDTYLLNAQYDQIESFAYTTETKTLTNNNIEHFTNINSQLLIVDEQMNIHRLTNNKAIYYNLTNNTSARLTVNSSYHDNKRKLWLSLNNNTIWFQPSADNLRFNKLKIPDNLLPNINQITEDNNGSILFANKDGLFSYNSDNREFKDITKHHQYIREIFSLVVDNNNNIWGSHENYIMQFSNTNNNTIIYSQSDGLNVALYERSAAVKDAQGRLLFGGADGIDIIAPESMRINRNPPNMFINTLTVNNQPLTTHRLDGTTPIVLASHQNVINFEFIAVELKQPRLNQYQFKLEGYDQQWSKVGKTRHANYGNLPPGNYTMLYRGTNNSGVWSEQTKQLKLCFKGIC